MLKALVNGKHDRYFKPFPTMREFGREIMRQLKGRWGSEPIWFTSHSKNVTYLREMRDKGQFTVILPADPRAMWWNDVVDRMVDIPVPVPTAKDVVRLAYRLGGRGKPKPSARSFRKRKVWTGRGERLCSQVCTRSLPVSSFRWLSPG